MSTLADLGVVTLALLIACAITFLAMYVVEERDYRQQLARPEGKEGETARSASGVFSPGPFSNPPSGYGTSTPLTDLTEREWQYLAPYGTVLSTSGRKRGRRR